MKFSTIYKLIATLWASMALVMVSCEATADQWSKEDKWRQGAYTVLHVMDWQQTHDIQDRGHGELNPILGEAPSAGEIDRYFAATLIMHYALSHSLNEKWRKRFQYVTIAVEAGAVANNFSLGYKVRF